MTVAELKQLLQNYPDDMEVVISRAVMGEVLQLDGWDTMYFVSKTKELYLSGKNAEKDGKVCQKALVLWAVPYDYEPLKNKANEL